MQRYGVLCAAFCCAPMDTFVDRAIHATAAICTSPLWSALSCSGTIGASASNFRATTPSEFLGQLAAWRRCNAPEKRDLFAFQICAGDDPFNPVMSVEVVADNDAVDERSLVRHLFELRLSPESFVPHASAAALAQVMGVLQQLPVESAYLAPAICWTRHPAVGRPDGRHAGPAFANRSLDIHVNTATRFVIGGRCRGARWVVVLGHSLAEKTGGDETMARLRSAGLMVTALTEGVMIQISDTPFEAVVPGTPLFARYDALAQELDAIAMVDDLDLERARFNANPDALDRYEQRFIT